MSQLILTHIIVDTELIRPFITLINRPSAWSSTSAAGIASGRFISTPPPQVPQETDDECRGRGGVERSGAGPKKESRTACGCAHPQRDSIFHLSDQVIIIRVYCIIIPAEVVRDAPPKQPQQHHGSIALPPGADSRLEECLLQATQWSQSMAPLLRLAFWELQIDLNRCHWR